MIKLAGKLCPVPCMFGFNCLVPTREEKVGLGHFSEQSFESIHHDIKLLWDQMKVSADHPDYAQKLLDFCSIYMGRHI